MMKKIISLLFAAVMFFAVGCGTGDAGEKNNGFTQIERVRLNQTKVCQGEWTAKIEANQKVLKELDGKRLLYFYYETAGLKPKNVSPYPGWEEFNRGASVGGHTLGHYLSACSMTYASTGKEEFYDIVKELIDELALCAQPNGYINGRPESDFDAVDAGRGDSGVAYYVVHKTLAGLVDAYEYCKIESALELAKGLGSWVYSRISKLSDEQIMSMLLIEYGGMNEALYRLYEISQDENHLKAAQAFDEKQYLNTWSKGEDNLTGKHANTQVPKAVGFAKGYLVTKDEKLLSAAQNFWKFVAVDRAYCTGGAAENEIFAAPGQRASKAYYNPSETCVCYNMAKLSQYLYEATGEVQYIEYLEKVLCNAILGSCDANGRKTYYQWLGEDSRKLYHTDEDSFWCCYGTGIESFAKVSQFTYYTTENGLIVNLFNNSSYDGEEIAVTMTGTDESHTLRVNRVTSNTNVYLRIPSWAKNVSVTLNGKEISAKEKDGFIVVEKVKENDEIVYATPCVTVIEQDSELKDCFNFRYGPYVLAAVGKRYEKKNAIKGSFTAGCLADLETNIIKKSDGSFLFNGDEDIIPLRKYSDIDTEFYTVYFKRVDEYTQDRSTVNLGMRATLTDKAETPLLLPNTQPSRYYYWTDGNAVYLDAIRDGRTGVDKTGTSEYSGAEARSRFKEAYLNVAPGNNWLCYRFDGKKTVKDIQIWFMVTSATPLPQNITIEYLSDGEWVSLNAEKKVNENIVSFACNIKTEAVRLIIDSDSRSGILEWIVR